MRGKGKLQVLTDTELICSLRKKVGTCGNRANISLQGLEGISKLSKEQCVPLQHFGGMLVQHSSWGMKSSGTENEG